MNRRPLQRASVGLAILALSIGCAGAGSSHNEPPVRPVASSSATAAATATAAEPSASPIEISIIGTSALHGRVGALPLLGGYVRALRNARPGRVVLLDAGDMFQGTLESNLNEGEVVVRAYRALGYDA